MKRLYPTVVLTGMLTMALGLSACSNWRTTDSSATGSSSGSTGTGSSGERASETYPAPPPAGGSASMDTGSKPAAQSGTADAMNDQTGSAGSSGMMGSGASDAQDAMSHRTSPPPSASTTPNSTVMSIEPMASGASGSSTGGATGSANTGSGMEPAYRITLRMDDGSTQVVSQATRPTYRSGDRVNLSGGVISR